MLCPEFSNDFPMADHLFIDNKKYNKLVRLKKKIDKINFEKKLHIWYEFIKIGNPYEYAPNIDLYKKISRAFYKLFEIDKKFNIIDKNKNIVSGHLCESPGGFIEYVQNITKKTSSCLAQSLRDSECKFSKKLKNITITYGSDATGDIFKEENIRDFIKKSNDLRKCDLITGDGGFDVSNNYLMQEQLSFRLIYCQTVTAIGALKTGGNFVCKLFDVYTLPTVQVVYLINQLFDKVSIFKPLISRPCNSERYIIAKGFKGILEEDLEKLIKNVTLFNGENKLQDLGIIISDKFISNILDTNNRFIDNQIKYLLFSFEMYENCDYKQRINNIKKNSHKISTEYIKGLYRK
jgi:23S rRNA U2552 (ribose-2'-O)-methylase RlmE/FtsJ